MRHAALLEAESVGKQLKLRPQTAHDRARDLERRLERRLADLALDEELIARPPVVSGGALVVPQGLLDRLFGRIPGPSLTARDTALAERRAVDAVLAAEHRLDRDPEETPHTNPGYDIRSRTADDHIVFIEVKGRAEGAEEFWGTRTEAPTGKNAAAGFRLPLVTVHPHGTEPDMLRNIVDPFRDR